MDELRQRNLANKEGALPSLLPDGARHDEPSVKEQSQLQLQHSSLNCSDQPKSKSDNIYPVMFHN